MRLKCCNILGVKFHNKLYAALAAKWSLAGPLQSKILADDHLPGSGCLLFVV